MVYQQERGATYRFSTRSGEDPHRGRYPHCSTIFKRSPLRKRRVAYLRTLTPFYRAFTQKSTGLNTLLSTDICYLVSILRCLACSSALLTSKRQLLTMTHMSKRCYRAFTHIFTVLSPILFSSQRSISPKPRTLPLHKFISSHLLTSHTVFSPMFLPCFGPSSYRALAHMLTVPSPTKISHVTVLSHINWVANRLNYKSISDLKDVLKSAIKKTSLGVMLLSFLLNTERRLYRRSHTV